MLSTLCKKCGSPIVADWRKDKHTIRNKQLEFCSRACANARHQLGEANIKRLQTFEKRRIDRPAKQIILVDNTCIQCNAIFSTAKGKTRKTCSRACQNTLGSINRQNYIKHHGTFATPRETFTYKDVVIEVDSQLEKAGVMYLMDTLNATRIERYNNLINYKDGENNRTFNPDFICIINNKTHIVEVKQLWSGKQIHPYARTVPLKKEALRTYCESKAYGMLWLDYNAAPSLKTIYFELLKKNASNKKTLNTTG